MRGFTLWMVPALAGALVVIIDNFWLGVLAIFPLCALHAYLLDKWYEEKITKGL